jgi:hypothetical protein
VRFVVCDVFVAAASSSDDDSLGNDAQSTPERERVRPAAPLPQHSDTSSTGSARETPPQIHRHTRLVLNINISSITKSQ